LKVEIQSTQGNFVLLEDLLYDVSADEQATFWTAFGQPAAVAREQASVEPHPVSKL
jgi:hypothetical protein